MVGDAPNTPQRSSSTEVTPSQAGEAAAAVVVQQRIADGEQRLADSLDIRDPSLKAPEPTPVETPASKPSAPSTLPGAAADGGLTQDLLERAADVGLTEEDAAAIPVATLRRMVTRLERQQPAQVEEARTDPRLPVEAAKRPEQAPLEDPDLPDLDPEYFDPKLVETWGKLKAHTKRQQELIKQQQQQLEETKNLELTRQQQMQAAKNAEDFESLESLIAADKDFADVLGEGHASTLDSRRFIQNRAEIAYEMDHIANRAIQRGQRPPPIDKLYERAKTNLFPERIQQRTEQQIGERVRNASGQFVARPSATTRNNELPHGPDRAVAALEKMMSRR